MSADPFVLDPALAKDSVFVGKFSLSQVRLMNDARFDWLLLIPERARCCEWFDLLAHEQHQLHLEVMHLAKLMKLTTGCDKINIGALGNIVAQLHVHIIARHRQDACWPAPPWGSAMQALDAASSAQRVQHWRDTIGASLSTGVEES
jgi:diadenosine tetraphosphate (Ap4A) HIT family hydrolase